MSKAAAPAADNVLDTPLAEALSERYLTYALSTIMSRSLPDARDGLKPVQRRLLYAMRLLKLDPALGHKKCARIVGDVIGKFHPHGEQAVYDTLVRLAQTFSMRYTLIDGHGNFGNVDGDNAAAQRYTEARLSPVSMYLLDGIDDDTVDFRPTYDGSEREPVVLPAAFPNLLANGASGIAVGMATSIPPHNVGELCDGLLYLIKTPNATVAKLVEMIPGPDFPGGGVLVEPRESILEAYKTGRGSFRLRARWTKEDLGRGQWRVIVDQIPYQVAKGRLVEKIAALMSEKKLPLLADVQDESADDIRLILEPKSRAVDADVLMESLFRATDLEVRFPLNLNVLDGGRVPKVMSLKEALKAYLDHRHEVLQRRSKHRLEAIDRRIEVLDGWLIAYRNLDAVIALIRKEDEPKPLLMKKFKLSEIQADAILDMRLRSLRKLEEKSIAAERDTLDEERKGLRKLLRDEDARWEKIAEEITALKQAFAGAADSGPAPKRKPRKGAKAKAKAKSESPADAEPDLLDALDEPAAAAPGGGTRLTALGAAPAVGEIPVESLVEKEPITVVCSVKGWIRALKGHVATDAEATYKEGDAARFWFTAETTDKLVLFSTDGRAFTIGCDKLPGGRGHGEPVRLMVDLGNDDDIVALFVYKADEKRLVAGADGRGFVVKAADMMAQTRAGKQVLNLGEGVKAAACVAAAGDTVAAIGDNRKLLLFPLADVPEMARGRGVRLQKFAEGGLADARVFALASGLEWTDPSGRNRAETALENWQGKRGQAGRIAPKGFNKTNKFA
jgi:topoisomerase IV subunit A